MAAKVGTRAQSVRVIIALAATVLLAVAPECGRAGEGRDVGLIVRDLVVLDAAGQVLPAGRFDPSLLSRIRDLPPGWLSGGAPVTASTLVVLNRSGLADADLLLGARAPAPARRLHVSCKDGRWIVMDIDPLPVASPSDP